MSEASTSGADGAIAMPTEPHLYRWAPALPAVTQAIVVGNPGAVASNASQVASLGRTLQTHGQEVTQQADNMTKWWGGSAGVATFDAVALVGETIGDHAGEMGKKASATLKLANDFKQLCFLVKDVQRMSDGVVAMLEKIPTVGPGLATAYGLKTAIWTGLCAAKLVNIGFDAVDNIKALNPKKIQQAYTPPPAPATPTPTTSTYTQQPAIGVFQS